jgi:hypothetical protein
MAQTLLVYDNVITIFVFATNEFTIGEQPGYALDLSDADKVYFTVKENLTDDDDDSLIQISSDGGLLYIVGNVASRPSDGVLTVGETTLGVKIVGDSAAELANKVGPSQYWDIKKVVNGEPIIVATGRAVLTLTATRALA